MIDKIISLTSVFLFFFIVSCNTPKYEKINNQWAYVTYDEGIGKRITKINADPLTFIVINNEYAKDKYKVFYKGRIINNADSKSFRVINKYYSKDKNNVYLFNYQIIGANPTNFEIIKEYFSKDKKHIFNGNIPLKINEIKSYKIIKTTKRIQMVSSKEFIKKYPSYSNIINTNKNKIVVYSNNSIIKLNDIIVTGVDIK